MYILAKYLSNTNGRRLVADVYNSKKEKILENLEPSLCLDFSLRARQDLNL